MLVKILGAGICGLTAAIVLKKAGIDVVIYEKRHHIGSSFKSTVHGMLNYNNFFNGDIVDFLCNQVELELENSFTPIKSLKRYSREYSNVSILDNKPVIYNFLRGTDKNSLDSELLRQAISLGIEIQFGSNIPEESCDVIASGFKYVDFKGYGVTYTDIKLDNLSEVKVFFDNDFAPGGYGYILPFNGNKTTIAIFTRKHLSKLPLDIYFERFLDILKDKEVVSGGNNIDSIDSGVGGFNLHLSYIRDGKIYAGVRAGLMTADYGFAMKESILSGYLAALSIIHRKNYNTLLRESLLPYLAKSIIKRSQMDRFDNSDYDRLLRESNNKVIVVKNKTYNKLGRYFILFIAYIYTVKKRLNNRLMSKKR